MMYAPVVKQGKRPNIPGWCPATWGTLMQHAWQPYPWDRITVVDLIDRLNGLLQSEEMTAFTVWHHILLRRIMYSDSKSSDTLLIIKMDILNSALRNLSLLCECFLFR